MNTQKSADNIGATSEKGNIMADGHYRFISVPAKGQPEDMQKALNESDLVSNLRATGYRLAFPVGTSDDGQNLILAYEAPSRGDFLWLIPAVPLIMLGVFTILLVTGTIHP